MKSLKIIRIIIVGVLVCCIQTKVFSDEITGNKRISIKDFGAKGDGIADDTAAIQAALNAAKGADKNGEGRSVFSLYFPSVKGGFYKVTDTLVIDGTHGLVIYGDGALTKRGANNATIRWYGTKSKPVFQVKGGTGSPSNPNFYITFRDLTISGYPNALDPHKNMPKNIALSGIHFGTVQGQNDATLCRRAIVENVHISNCRFGIWSGNSSGKNTDHAALAVSGCYIANNAQAGIYWSSGNALADVISCNVVNNGWAGRAFSVDAYSSPVGANIHVMSGYMNIVNYISSGNPSTADIYQGNGRTSVINAWSDTFGYFFYQSSCTPSRGIRQTAQITGVRHYAGGMNEQNTPNSMRIVAPGTFVSSCTVFGNIEVVSELSGRPIFAGINFIRPGATYIGSGVNKQRSLMVLGNAENYAQILLGGADSGVPLKHKGAIGPSTTPQILSMGRNLCLFQVLDAASSGTGLGFYTKTDDANSANSLIMNGYVLSTGILPMQANKMVWLLELGGLHGLNLKGFDRAGYCSEIPSELFVSFGGFKGAPDSGCRDEVTFQPPERRAPPSYNSGDFWHGTIYYDTTKKTLRVNTGGSKWENIGYNNKNNIRNK